MCAECEREIRETLSKVFEELLATYKDTPETRLIIAQYTMGYMGASYGLKVD
jgi:hypothetical protein